MGGVGGVGNHGAPESGRFHLQGSDVDRHHYSCATKESLLDDTGGFPVGPNESVWAMYESIANHLLAAVNTSAR